MDAAFVTTWKIPFQGREQKALEFAGEAAEYWQKQAAAGRCSEPEYYFFPNGVGMWMVKGDRAVLEELAASDEGRRLLVRGNLLLEDWQYSFAETGNAAERFMNEYAAALATV